MSLDILVCIKGEFVEGCLFESLAKVSNPAPALIAE